MQTVKTIVRQTGCLLMSVRGKQTREAIHIHLFFSYLEMITPPVLAFERNLTMGNGFINVSWSYHTMKTQIFFSFWDIKKKPKFPLAKLGLNEAKYLLSRLRGKSLGEIFQPSPEQTNQQVRFMSCQGPRTAKRNRLLLSEI